ncbi:MAG: hypothetical protein HY231_21850 [Acidobacteria bacterium]|nr:hypothetical protein [Acidobacteriota bacterium]
MTAILVLKYPDEIILAADGKMTSVRDEDSVVRKIRGVGNYFFTASGLIFDKTTGFQLLNAVMFGIVDGQTFEENVQDVERHLKYYLTDTYKKWRAAGDTDSLQHYRNQKFILVTFEDGQPKVSVIQCSREDTQDGFTIHSEITNIDSEKGGWVLGDAALQFADQNGQAYRNDHIEFAFKIIQAEIKNTPQYVGYPIDVLRLTEDGAEIRTRLSDEDE